MNSPYESAMSIATPGVTTPRPMRSRTQSISSDRPSLLAYSLLSPPLCVTPEAGFIAASAASQIVTNDHDAHAAIWYDQHGIEPSEEPAVVSSSALQLVNSFLDQLLFNILSKSRSTALSALRPAVTEVLKPKLAKDAINQADEELREYLGSGDEDELLQQGMDSSRDWDLELVWKRTRLRCMVYSSLGDLEEEDEDYYTEREGFELDGSEEPFEVVSPAVAIFLTSILEYMGEQALVVAGQGAYHRLQSRFEKEVANGTRDPSHVADRVVIDELDMDRVALDRTLGRLWRAWKKRIRSPTFESRPYSRGSAHSFHFRQNSLVPTELPLPEAQDTDQGEGFEGDDRVAEPVSDELMTALSIPLPLSERDVDEIEVPGLVSYSEDEDEDEEERELVPRRPRSMLLDLSSALSTLGLDPLPRKRSSSVPRLSNVPFSLRCQHVDLTDGVDDSFTLNSETSPTPADEEKHRNEVADATTGLGVVSHSAPESDAVDGHKAGHKAPVIKVEEDDVEHFEILTTSRVSISGSTSPSIPDSDGGHSRSSSRQAARPASISSPRLIEVTGFKSPTTRSPVTQHEESFAPVHAVEDGLQRPRAVETIYRSPISSPVSRSSADRIQWPTRSHAKTAISEVEEDQDAPSALAESSPTAISGPSSTTANDSPGDQSQYIKQSHAMSGYSRRRHAPPSPIQEHVYTGTTATTMPDGKSHDEDGSTPPVPPRRDVPNRSYPLHAQDRAARQPSSATTNAAGAGTVAAVERPGVKQDASDDVTSIAMIPPRPIHTSGSTASSATNRLKPVRTSEESRPENVARNFEDLIHSDETIQYTLTPESMRDIDSSSLSNTSPVLQSKARRSDDLKRLTTERSRSLSNSSSVKRVGGSSIEVSRQNGSSMHSLSPQRSTLSGPVPRAPRNGIPHSARSSVQARDARVPRDSTNDFADFIRSTGPAGSGNGPAPLRDVAQGPGSIISAKNGTESRRVSTVSSATYSNRNRLQARDATVDRREDHSDLIDFIRRGPADGPGAHRIPRAVAPFRTTMDSDQLQGAVGGRAVDATIPGYRDSQASTTVTDVNSSMHSSINSQSALLRNRQAQQMGGALDEDDHMPKRKTRRIKDPYAIDFSDDEEAELYGMPPKPAAKKEESLAEFLMNYEPAPAAPVAQPAPQTARYKKKSSASNLIGRFRSGSRHTPPPLPTPPAQSSTAAAPRTGTGGSSGRGHIPIQVSMLLGYDKYGPIDRATPSGNSINNNDSNNSNSASSRGGVPRKKFEPRDPMVTASRSGTSDLAAFLKTSEPPFQPPPIIEEQPSGGTVSRILGRRKKSLAA